MNFAMKSLAQKVAIDPEQHLVLRPSSHFNSVSMLANDSSPVISVCRETSSSSGLTFSPPRKRQREDHLVCPYSLP